ncbi:MAG: hypothetical protein AAGF87_07200 [Bacteroidota bacterium]
MKLFFLTISIAATLSQTACSDENPKLASIHCGEETEGLLASLEFVDSNGDIICYQSSDILDLGLDYSLQQDGPTDDLPLVPWRNMYLRLTLNIDDLDDPYHQLSFLFRNTPQDSAEWVQPDNEYPLLTPELIISRLLPESTIEAGPMARVDLSTDRFSGMSYAVNPDQDIGSVQILRSELGLDEAGQEVIKLEMTFNVLIRQAYLPDDLRQLQNGVLTMEIPIVDLIP